MRLNWFSATNAVILLSVVKPQYLTLLLPLIMYRQWRELIRGLRYTLAISVIGFILFTNNPITVFQQWLLFAVNYNDDANYFYPYNISIAKTFTGIIKSIGPAIDQFPFDPQNFSALTIVIIFGTLLILPLVLFGTTTDQFSAVIVSLVLGSLLVPTSNYYYQNFVIVIIALILKDPLGGTFSIKHGTLDNRRLSSNTRSFVKWFVIIASLNFCFNLPISSEDLPFGGTNMGRPTSVSRLLVGPLWL